jgi:type III pantothenate kinase
MKKRALLIDLGNTRLKWALAQSGRISDAAALDWPSVELPIGMWRDAGIECIGIASVASATVRARLFSALTALTAPVIEAAVAARWRDLRCAYPKPERFGVDRWLALIATYCAMPDESRLVVAAGTALTIDLLDAHGEHRGGVIAPGLAAMREGLFAKAPGLAQYSDGTAGTGMVNDSADAIASGCLQAALGLIERHRAVPDGRSPRAVVISGGDAAFLATHLVAPCEVRPWLVLEGLAHWLDDAASARD